MARNAPKNSERRNPAGDCHDIALDFLVEKEGDKVGTFLQLGRSYLGELDPGRSMNHERFLKSIVGGIGKPERWLALLRYAGEPVGFTHFKIDRKERPGWGYILEFGIIPSARRRGLGRKFCALVIDRLKTEGVPRMWLGTDAPADAFWSACGFKEAGKDERGQIIMIADLGRDKT